MLAVGLLFGAVPVYALLAVPLAALTVTIVDVVVRGWDRADAEVPAMLFTPSDTESDRFTPPRSGRADAAER